MIVSGLDLGQRRDFTAFASAEREAGVYTLVALHRFQLGESYVSMVNTVKRWYDGERLTGTLMGVDHTGVGRPVVDMFRFANIRAAIKPITITGGKTANKSDVGYTVPKHDLVAVVQVCLGERRLRIPASLPHGKTLVAELQNFRAKLTAGGSETFEAARERDHDDLVLATAVMLWCGEKLGSGNPRDIGLPEKRSEVPNGVFEDDTTSGLKLWEGSRG